MNKATLMDMISMRLDGATYEGIARKHGVTKQSVYQVLANLEIDRHRKHPKFVYPNIGRWMDDNQITFAALAKEYGAAPTTVSSWLRGNSEPSVGFAKFIVKKSGMSFEEAFKEKYEEE